MSQTRTIGRGRVGPAEPAPAERLAAGRRARGGACCGRPAGGRSGRTRLRRARRSGSRGRRASSIAWASRVSAGGERGEVGGPQQLARARAARPDRGDRLVARRRLRPRGGRLGRALAARVLADARQPPAQRRSRSRGGARTGRTRRRTARRPRGGGRRSRGLPRARRPGGRSRAAPARGGRWRSGPAPRPDPPGGGSGRTARRWRAGRAVDRRRSRAVVDLGRRVVGMGLTGSNLRNIIGCMKRFECSAVVFDLDGVLVDSTAYVEQQWRAGPARRGPPVPSRFCGSATGAARWRPSGSRLPHLDAEAEVAAFVPGRRRPTAGRARAAAPAPRACCDTAPGRELGRRHLGRPRGRQARGSAGRASRTPGAWCVPRT